jgi:ribonuclease D
MTRKKKPSVYSLALQQVQQGNQDEQELPTVQVLEQQDSKTARQSNVQTSEHPDSKMVKQQRIKATFYLQPEDIIAIDEMQTKRFRENGKKPEKSELVSEAIQLLSKQRNS